MSFPFGNMFGEVVEDVNATCEATAVLETMAEALQMPTGDNQ